MPSSELRTNVECLAVVMSDAERQIEILQNRVRALVAREKLLECRIKNLETVAYPGMIRRGT